MLLCRLGQVLSPVRHGFLWKRSRAFKSWLSRWFQLDDTGFTYAVSPKVGSGMGCVLWSSGMGPEGGLGAGAKNGMRTPGHGRDRVKRTVSGPDTCRSCTLSSPPLPVPGLAWDECARGTWHQFFMG